MIELTDKQKELLAFVILKHGDQVRKYTGEPYWNHTVEVASICFDNLGEGVEIALCHDLFEDTNCNFSELYKELIRIGYTGSDSYKICTVVTELTDKFTHEDHPHLNRAKRKTLEAERLGGISVLGQSVKYADLIDNTKSIVSNDPKFAKTYLKEKAVMLSLMTLGDKDLYNKCINLIT